MQTNDEKSKAPRPQQDDARTKEAERQANAAHERRDSQAEPEETAYDLGDGSDGGAAGDGED
ncbi:MAG: hypothetical protein JSS82_15380 [Bacteroidetes bacterium]|nr:hypothetical protein [Bacteroidota bacterium]